MTYRCPSCLLFCVYKKRTEEYTMADIASKNILAWANEIVNTAAEAYIGVIDEDGFPSVSTISSIHTDGIYKAYFATGIHGNKAIRIQNNCRTSVCYREGQNNVSLVGEAIILTDISTRHALWQDWFMQHFPGGKDDPTYCIIQFTSIRASLWIHGKSAVLQIADICKAHSCCGLLCDTCTFKESCNCGCLETKGHPFYGTCPVAACCIEKGFEHCGMCPDMPCAQLHAYSCLDKEHGDIPPGARLELLRHWKKYTK